MRQTPEIVIFVLNFYCLWLLLHALCGILQTVGAVDVCNVSTVGPPSPLLILTIPTISANWSIPRKSTQILSLFNSLFRVNLQVQRFPIFSWKLKQKRLWHHRKIWLLLQNCPHHTHDRQLAFKVPVWWQMVLYTLTYQHTSFNRTEW